MSDILTTHPARDTFDLEQLRRAIDAALRCTSTCATCADACLHGDDPAGMRQCIDRCTQCSIVCAATAQVLSRPGPNGSSWRSVVEACIAVCEECVEECGSHDDDHCRACAEACRECVEACRALLAVAD